MPGERPGVDSDVVDELVDGGEPLECLACIEAGDVCSFHAGWATGWDACAEFVAHVVEERRADELLHVGDVEEAS